MNSELNQYSDIILKRFPSFRDEPRIIPQIQVEEIAKAAEKHDLREDLCTDKDGNPLINKSMIQGFLDLVDSKSAESSEMISIILDSWFQQICTPNFPELDPTVQKAIDEEWRKSYSYHLVITRLIVYQTADYPQCFFESEKLRLFLEESADWFASFLAMVNGQPLGTWVPTPVIDVENE